MTNPVHNIITPVIALRTLWLSVVNATECDTPTEQVFAGWLRAAPFEECTKAIRKSGKKMNTTIAAGVPLLGRTSAARYVSAILGEYRRRTLNRGSHVPS
jgi:hypothetical protein